MCVGKSFFERKEELSCPLSLREESEQCFTDTFLGVSYLTSRNDECQVFTVQPCDAFMLLSFDRYEFSLNYNWCLYLLKSTACISAISYARNKD